MKPGSVKNLRYDDAVARAREHKKSVWRTVSTLLTGGLTGGAIYWVLLSGAFAIQNIELTGLERVNHEYVMKRVEDARTATLFGIVPLGNNTLFFNVEAVRALLLAEFPEIKSVEVKRDPFHRIQFTVTERQVVGIWCFTPLEKSRPEARPVALKDGTGVTEATAVGRAFSNGAKKQCRHFDADGRAWGDVSRSSGSILLVVDDEKHDPADFIGPSLLQPVRAVADGLARQGVRVQYLKIPDNQFDDIWAVTNKGYPIYFNRAENIDNQLNTLKIFLENKSNDPNFHPQYLDVRIAGRVYYK